MSPARTSFDVQPGQSALLIEARSSVGPISFGTTSLQGVVTASIVDGGWAEDVTPTAAVTLDMTSLASGNSLYDAELAQRIDSRRHPHAELVLDELVPLGLAGRYQASGSLTLHGVTRPLAGTVTVTTGEDGTLLVDGEQVVDIREFGIPTPTVLMLRIYPDVRVHMHLHLARAERGSVVPLRNH